MPAVSNSRHFHWILWNHFWWGSVDKVIIYLYILLLITLSISVSWTTLDKTIVKVLQNFQYLFLKIFSVYPKTKKNLTAIKLTMNIVLIIYLSIRKFWINGHKSNMLEINEESNSNSILTFEQHSPNVVLSGNSPSPKNAY